MVICEKQLEKTDKRFLFVCYIIKVMNTEKGRLVFSCDKKELVLLEDTVRSYCKTLDFGQDLRAMIIGSVLEACEELIRISEEKGRVKDFEVSLDYKDKAIKIQIIYDGKIPFDPQDLEAYKGPLFQEDMEDLSLEALWLHLIKKRMDICVFRVAGAKKILEMVKYQRAKGQEKQAWIMGITPLLRDDLQLDIKYDKHKKVENAVLSDEKTGNVLKLDASGVFIVQKMDGKHTFNDIYFEHIDKLGLISPEQLQFIYEKLLESKMIERRKRKRKENIFKRILKNLISPDFSIPYANEVVSFVYKRFKFLFNPWGVGVLVLIGVSGFWPFIQNEARFRVVLNQWGRIFTEYPIAILYIYVIMLGTVVLHELAHGLTCKHYDGRVDKMGIMFYLAMFIFYCDTTSSWNFKKKSEKVMVSLGGPIISFAILGVICWVFGLMAGTNVFLETVLVTLIILEAFGLVMNFNPFIRMDAYYMLMDYLEFPNLRARSFDYLEEQFLRLFGIKPRKETLKSTKRDKIIFWIYGILGALVSLFFVVWPLYRYGRILIYSENLSGMAIFGMVMIALILINLSRQTFSKVKAVRYREYKL